MCGRFTLTIDIRQVAAHFGLDSVTVEFHPRYNIAPSQESLVIVAEDPKILRTMQWGLIPFWSKDRSIGNKMINARAETLPMKPSFKKSFERRRCLVPADGFYEWRKAADGKSKIPTRIVLKSREPFAFAGLWDTWKVPGGGDIHSFTIITTTANDLLRPIHDRMPVILPRAVEDVWLDPGLRDPLELSRMLKPYPGELMDMYTVSTLVNSPRNDNPTCVELVPEAIPIPRKKEPI